MVSDSIVDHFDFPDNFNLISQVFELRHENLMLQIEVDKLKLLVKMYDELKETNKIIENWSL
jgi:hypothetical protein